MKRPRSSRYSSGPQHRLNGRIRAREVRVVSPDGKSLGILPLRDAINLARSHGLDLVEIAPQAQPPVCRIVDYGKFCYKLAKKEKEARKHQHAGKVKEVQLRPNIDPHDLSIKLKHAIEFLCDDMKVKVSLRFRGREMARPDLGMQVVRKFIQELAPWGACPDTPRQAGRNIHAIINPLPRQKRAPNPYEEKEEEEGASASTQQAQQDPGQASGERPSSSVPPATSLEETARGQPEEGFRNNPFDQLDNRPG